MTVHATLLVDEMFGRFSVMDASWTYVVVDVVPSSEEGSCKWISSSYEAGVS